MLNEFVYRINHNAMLLHYLKTSYVHFKRNLSFSIINMFGLATAMAVCLMIFLFVAHELSFDRFHPRASDTYRIGIRINIQGDVRTEAISSHAKGPDLLERLPEVIAMTRLSHWHAPVHVWRDDSYIRVENGMYAESSFFEVFSFDLLRGNPGKALEEPFSVVLTETLAKELFPGQDPMGKMLRLDDQQQLYAVTGIAGDSPPNSHLQFDMLRSYPSLREISSSNYYDWDANLSAFTYVVVEEGTDMESLKAKTRELTDERLNYRFEGMGVYFELDYYPIGDIRLRSSFGNEMVETATLGKVRIFTMVALFVLFIAGFNYVNLTIAKSGKRAREVGMRKVLGAGKSGLKKQFTIETLFITGLSFVLGLIIAETGLPAFNNLLGSSLSLTAAPWWTLFAAFFLFCGVFGTMAGLYPAWYMASFQPVKILKGEFWSRPGRFQPRNLLLLIQFLVSIALIVCTLVILIQIRHLRRSDLGFNSNNLLTVSTANMEDARLFSQAMEAWPWTTAVTISSSFPGGSTYTEGIEAEDAGPGIMAQRLWSDQRYLGAMEVELEQGRWFESDDGLDRGHVLINQAFARKAGWAEPLGKTIGREGETYRVIGVVRDFHLQSLHNEVEPLTINAMHSRPQYIQAPWWVTLRHENVSSTEVLRAVSNAWQQHFPEQVLSYYFISEVMETQYGNERSFGHLFLAFTLLAIVIAMLGVMGLSSYAAQQRQKETGIRKVLGASVFSVLFRMSSDFVRWLLLAALIALPLAYWYMDNWLQGYAYSVDFPYWTMLAATAGMMIISLAIVATQSLRSALANPVESLKYE